MAVAGYPEQEKICQDQGEISHRRLQKVSLLQAAGQRLYKEAAARLQDVTPLLLTDDERTHHYLAAIRGSRL